MFAGLMYSFPVTCSGGEWKIVDGLSVSTSRPIVQNCPYFSSYLLAIVHEAGAKLARAGLVMTCSGIALPLSRVRLVNLREMRVVDRTNAQVFMK
jgi:hypothetical protein